ncbi:MAG: F0F1 ATP synthase subunit delta [Dehalococcoidales bacterium]|nr:F0F1 ATP synthase subunit delta [Dehalococcoidales bacterium]
MAKKLNARPYAQAVFEIAQKENKTDRWQSDLEEIASVTGDAILMAWMENPKIRSEDKLKLLSERLPGISPLALNLLRLLIARRKVEIAGQLAAEYHRLVYRQRGIEHAEVITAVPLSDEDKQTLAERLGAIVGKKVVLQPSVDPKILGGIIARINGKLLDASTQSKLEALRKELAGAGSRG